MQLTNNPSNPTMTSREIATLTDKEHGHVLRDIKSMFEALEIDPEGYLQNWIHPQNGQTYRVYALSEDLTLTLVAGYNAKLRLRIIQRWKELEAKVPTLALPDFSNPAEAARAWAIQYEARAALETKVQADAPKVAFAEVIRAMDAVCHIGQFCKTMRIGRNRLFKRMKDDGILMANRMPYQKYVDKGYFSVIEQKPYTNSKGETRTCFTTMVTGAGQVFLARRYADMMGAV